MAPSAIATTTVNEPSYPLHLKAARPTRPSEVVSATPSSVIHSTSNGYNCSSSLEIAHSYHFVERVFDQRNAELANMYMQYGRCLAIVDHNVFDMYAGQIEAYFATHGVKPTLHRAHVAEDNKNMDTMTDFCRYMTDFGILRREPVLVIGGGLITDVVG